MAVVEGRGSRLLSFYSSAYFPMESDSAKAPVSRRKTAPPSRFFATSGGSNGGGRKESCPAEIMRKRRISDKRKFITMNHITH